MASFFTALRQGRLLKHPIHPLLVHIPVGLWVAALILDLFSWSGVTRQVAGPLLVASYYCIEIGLFGAFLAIPFGLIEFSYTPRGSRARSAALAHVGFVLPSVALEAVNFALRKTAYGHPQPPGPLGILLSFLAVCFLSVAGYLGGSLIYQHGLGRAPENRPLPLPNTRENELRARATRSGTSGGEEAA